MNLHENQKLFRQAIQFTAQQMGIPDIYVEKDYWVVYVLNAIFISPMGNDVVFKGGTSLSKCFGILERFSEDIDLVVLRRDGESNSQLSNKIRQIDKIVADLLPEVVIDGVTNKKGMIRKTAHRYPQLSKDEKYGQIRDVIVVESSWLGCSDPNQTRLVCSYIYEMLDSVAQHSLAHEYGMSPFSLTVLDLNRTLCEKIMSLVRFSYSDTPIDNLKKKVRHCYDIHQLLQQKELLEFFHSYEFDVLLLKVANDDVVAFKNNNEWLKHHPVEAMLFADLEPVWNSLKISYNNDFKHLVFGDFPKDKNILETLSSCRHRLKSIEWKIDL